MCSEIVILIIRDTELLTSHGGEVDLGLESEDGEAERDGGAHAHGHQHLVRAVVGGDGAQHEALRQGEEAEEDEVVRRLPADPLAAGQRDEGHDHDDQGYPPHLGVARRVQLHTLHREDSNDAHRDHKLNIVIVRGP